MTGILGIGTDMLQLSRFQTVVRRYGGSKLASRICSPSELADYRQTLSAGSEEAQTRWLALRWTAKEALFKAINRGTWKDATITKSQLGKPIMHLSARLKGEGSPALGQAHAHLSVTHDADLMIAFVVVEAAQKD